MHTYTIRQLINVFIINQSLHWMVIGVIIPVMTLIQLEKGLDLFQIGLSIAIMSGAVIVLELPTGGLADAIGRKRLYLISMIVTILSMSIVLISWDFYSIAAGFLIMGVARALSSGSIDAWFVDEFMKINPQGNLQKALAKAGIFIPLGLGLGSLLGGVLPMTLGQWTKTLPGLDIYSGNLMIAIVFGGIQLLTTSLIVHEHQPPQSAKFWEGFKKVPETLSTAVVFGIRHRVVFLLLLTSLAWGVGLSGLETFWQPQVKDMLASEEQTWVYGLLSAAYFLAASLGSWAITPICSLFNNHYPLVLFGVRLLMGSFLALLAFQTNLIGFSIFYVVLFSFNGMANAPHGTLFNREVPSERRSTLLSFDSLFMQTGGLLGTLILGYLANTYSIPIAWWVGATVLMGSAFLYLLIPKSKV